MSVKRFGYGCEFDGNSGPFVKYEDYAALEARCAALAAEMSAVLTDRAVILEDLDNTCFEIGMQRGEKAAAYPTPTVANHDLILDEVRASAVEEFVRMADYSESVAYGEVIVTSSSVFAAGHEYAAQLRKGVQS
ncbi:hypothetical protein RM407_000203 [Enterobacter kobei]|nr:hypothetical protein [Enterobacter kobei]